MGGWFETIGYWEQEEAYQAFDKYRDAPTDENREAAIFACLGIIRVVYSASRIKTFCQEDTQDLISSAVETIIIALPKMREKTKEQIGAPVQLARYLYSCVLNAFRKEFKVLYSKQKKILKKLEDESMGDNTKIVDMGEVDAQIDLDRVDKVIISAAEANSRFDPNSIAGKFVYLFIRSWLYCRSPSTTITSLYKLQDNERKFLMDYADFLIRRGVLELSKLLV